MSFYTLVFQIGLGCSLSSIDDSDAGLEIEASPLELEVHDLVNAHRESIGLWALEWSNETAVVSRGHSDDMAAGDVAFGHDGFDQRFLMLVEEIEAFGAGENVAWLFRPPDPAEDVVEGWLNSDGHRANIEGDFDAGGVGLHLDGEEYWFTHIFVSY